MKRLLLAAVASLAPVAGHAQGMFDQTLTAQPGFYVGAQGGLNWLLNTSMGNSPTNTGLGWVAGGVAGYDFVGPRVELEARYSETPVGYLAFVRGQANNTSNQLSFLVNVLYDFFPTAAVTPYVGAGAGIGFVDSSGSCEACGSLASTTFAYQGIVGVGWRLNDNFRMNLDGRYFGTTNPSVTNIFGQPSTWTNNNFSVMLGLQYKFVAAAPPPPPPPPAVEPPSFMVFFDWDRSNLSAQALNTIKQAAGAYKTKGNARITATGHTDTSGSESYNMALSLRRANAVKDALLREGVPATAIAVVGRGEQGLLVQTGPNVREPQNRRVEIVIQ
ncbi:OmpA family protein [Reyranella sp.]|uniref:OmpA family protein n=1 Tax=Reyranella sp. TaxID=1929291 RepID=UPI0040370A8D